MNSIYDWYELLEKRPDDWETRKVFSDWLEEVGELVLSVGQRYQIRCKKYPQKVDPGWRWHVDLRNQDLTFSHHTVNATLRQLMTVWNKGTLSHIDFITFQDLLSSEVALANALVFHNQRNTNDSNNPCWMWAHPARQGKRDCDGDGHYMCSECGRFAG